MSHFYGTVQGGRGESTRTGHKSSGLTATAASWAGAIRVDVYVDEDGDDAFEVHEIRWRGAGVERLIAKGKLGEEVP